MVALSFALSFALLLEDIVLLFWGLKAPDLIDK